MSDEQYSREVKKEELQHAMLEEEERLKNEEMDLEDEEYSPSSRPTPVAAKPDDDDMETDLSLPAAVIDQAPQRDREPEVQEQEVVTAALDQAPVPPSTLTTANNMTPIAPASNRTAASNDPETVQKRRENHRLVERRRRDAINKGINELAEAIPDCPKKRSTVILKAIEHISDLKGHNEQVCHERDVLKEQNQLLIKELAEKNKKINELLLLL